MIWSLRLQNPARKFEGWVITPAGVGLTVFAGLVLVVKPPYQSVLESKSPTYELLRYLPGHMASLGSGFFLALAGLTIICISVQRFSRGRIALPIRFRGATRDEGSDLSRTGRNILIMVFGTGLIVSLASCYFVVWGYNAILSFQFMTGFGGYDWVLSTAYAAFATILSAIIFGQAARGQVKVYVQRLGLRDATQALLIALVILLLPRILEGVSGQFDWESVGIANGDRYSWTELLLPQPFPWVLLVFVTAFFQEIVLRGFLQTLLTEALGLKRAIFLVGLLWGILPLHYGIHPLFDGGSRIAGIEALITWAILVAYGVVIGWVFARTGSLLTTVVLHGTFMIFHESSNREIYLRHPAIYWFEVLLLIATGWYLFKRYPVVQGAAGSDNGLVPGLERTEAT